MPSDFLISEISGKPGQVWGNVIVPAGGRTIIRIVGDTLQTSSILSYGLEKKSIQTRIQEVGSIEVVEGRLWWLLVLGLVTLWFLIGIVFIILFFVIKQRWIVIYARSATLILFYKQAVSSDVEQFATNVMTLSQKLNQVNAN